MAQHMAQAAHCPLAETLRLMLPAEMRGNRVHEKTQTMVQLTIRSGELDAALAAQGRSGRKRMLLNLLSDGEKRPVAELKLLIKEPLEPLRQLQDAGYVRLTQEEVLRRPGAGEHVTPV